MGTELGIGHSEEPRSVSISLDPLENLESCTPVSLVAK